MISKIVPELEHIAIPVEKLHEDPENIRVHDDRSVEAVAESFNEFGQRKPIVALDNGKVVAGNAGLVAARDLLGWSHVAVVRFRDDEEEKALRFAIADNRTAELSWFDETRLREAVRKLQAANPRNTHALGFSADEVKGMVEGLAIDLNPRTFHEFVSDNGGSANPATEEVPEPPKVPVTKVGDVWRLGDHTVVCGDMRECADLAVGDVLAKLIFTDPPYGVDYTGGTTKRERISGDESTALYGPACELSFKLSDGKAALYLWHAGVKGIAAAAAAAAAGYTIRCELIWNKNLAQFGALSAQYKQKHEPAYYCHKRGKAPRWFGPTNEVTVWDCPRAMVNEFHPTQKPVDLSMRAMRNSSERGALVADWFLGSGSTLIGAETLERRCAGVELSPAFCDVIVERWENISGKKAQRRP